VSLRREPRVCIGVPDLASVPFLRCRAESRTCRKLATRDVAAGAFFLDAGRELSVDPEVVDVVAKAT
jgi:hypothetical protein